MAIQAPPEPIWTPGPSRQAGSRLARFLADRGHHDYDRAWRWSVDPSTAGEFWRSVADEFEIPWRTRPATSLQPDPSMVTGARWFSGGRLNYAEAALDPPGVRSADLAVVSRSQTRPGTDLTWAELRSLVGRVRAGLMAAGIGPGDRVAAYLPNIPEALAAMLATASLGAVWTCCAPEMGVAGVLDRLSQVSPKVLFAVDGYVYGSRAIDRRDESEAVRSELGSATSAVWVPYLHPDRPSPRPWTTWEDFAGGADQLEFRPVDFDHALYILFSSGTTGQPKPIVHGHGAMVLEHSKALGLHFDLGPGDRFFWFTTTGWMMWNFCVSGLLVGATVVLFDGDPGGPAGDELWSMMATTATTCGGVGAGYLVACSKTAQHPSRQHDLSALKTLGATGSPLPGAAAEWVYREVGADIMLASFSGGTDVCTGFVGTSPLHPVWRGEISCRCLGAAVEVFDDAGQPIIGEEGELVLTAPMPSMPVGFWGDEDGSRYHAAYFERYAGVWAHGDRATLTERGTIIITGRSDGTLNRGGVRMGTAEFYEVVDAMPEVSDSLVVHVSDPDGGPGELWLFVVETEGQSDAQLPDRIKKALRRDLSPRHVPDRIVSVPAVPRTLSGKRLEVPVKRILTGVPPQEALALASVANPESLEPFIRLAAGRPTSED